MKKNLYYRAVEIRRNLIGNAILDLFLSLSSYPRLALEVFLRKHFGERYFSLSSAITVAVILALLPIMEPALETLLGFHSRGFHREIASFWGKYFTWYMFLAAYCFFAIQRFREVRRCRSVFDFGRYSKFHGTISKKLLELKFFGRSFSVRQIEVWVEPGLFFLAGLLLTFLNQKLGNLWIVCSVIYSQSYAALYKKGDDFVMDTIDEMLMNEEMETTFVNGKEGHIWHGVRFYSRRPSSTSNRQKLADNMVIYEGADMPTLAS